MVSFGHKNPFVVIHNSNFKNRGKCYSFLLAIKLRIFDVFYIILSNYKNSDNEYIIILSLIELIQLLSFCFDDIYKSTWIIQEYSLLFEFIQKVFNFFLLAPYLQLASNTLFTFCFYIFTISSFICFIIFIFLMIVVSNVSYLPIWLLSLFAEYGRLILSIFTLPIVYTITSFFNKSEINTFYIIGSISLAIICFLGIMFCLLSIDLEIPTKFGKNNFYSNLISSSNDESEINLLTVEYHSKTPVKISNEKHNYLTSFSTNYLLYFFILKIITVICFTNLKQYLNDLDNETHILITVILFILSFFYWLIHYKQKLFFFNHIETLFQCCSLVFFITTTLLLCNKILIKFNQYGFHAFVEIWLLLILLAIIYFICYNTNYIAKLNYYESQKNNPKKALEHINLFCEFNINKLFHERIHNAFYGFIMEHSLKCTNLNCGLNKFKQYIISNEKIHSEQENKFINSYINNLYIEYIDYFPKSPTIRVSYAFFLVNYMNNIALAKIQIIIALLFKPSYREQFSLYRLYKSIEDNYINSDYYDNENLDIASSIIFNQYFDEFKEMLLKINYLYINLWMSMIKDEISIKKIKENGFNILGLTLKLFSIFNKMQQIKPKDKESLQLFGYFLIDILNENELGHNYLDKSNTMISYGLNIKLFDNNLLRLSEDGSPVLVSAPGTEENNLIITQTTNSITKLFGYKKEDLIGKDVNILLPEELRTYHNAAIVNFIKQNNHLKSIQQQKISGSALHKTGNIFQVKMILVLMPNLSNNSNYAIVFNQEQKNFNFNYIGYIMTNNIFDIYYISSQCNFIFGLNEKALWKLKNRKKLKSEDRINLAHLVEEFDITNISSFINEKNKLVHTVKYADAFTERTPLSKTKRFSNKFPTDFTPTKRKSIEINEQNTNPHEKMSLLQSSSTFITKNIVQKQSGNVKPKIRHTHNTQDNFLMINNANNNLSSVYVSIFPIKIKQTFTEYYSFKFAHIMQCEQVNPTHINANSVLSPRSPGKRVYRTITYETNNNINNNNQYQDYIMDFKFFNKLEVEFEKNKNNYIITNKKSVQPKVLKPFSLGLFKQRLQKELSMQSYKKKKLNKLGDIKDKKTDTSKTLIQLNNNFSHRNSDFIGQNSSDLLSSSSSNSNSSSSSKSSINNTLSSLEQDIEEDNVYNTLNFTNYGEGVIYYPLDSLKMEPSKICMPQNKMQCEDLIFFFNDDTIKENDFFEETNESINDKKKYEIQKIKIFEDYNKRKIHRNIKTLSIFSLIGILIFLVISTVSYVFYRQYLSRSEVYTKGLVKISLILNYTITSSDLILNMLLINHPSLNISDPQKLSYINRINNSLIDNSIEINDLISFADKETILSQVTKEINNRHHNIKKENITQFEDHIYSNPLLLRLYHYISFDYINKNISYSIEEVSYNEATVRLTTSIFSLIHYKNFNFPNPTFFETDVFMLCYNAINEFYQTSQTIISYIAKLINELTPQKQVILIYISLATSCVLFIVLFFLFRQPVTKMNSIVKEIISLKNDEIQFIVKQGEIFNKKCKAFSTMAAGYIGQMKNDLDEENSREEERENEFENKKNEQQKENNKQFKNDTNYISYKKQNKNQYSKNKRQNIKRSLIDNIIVLIFELSIFVVVIIYFVIQYLIIKTFNMHLDQFVKLFNVVYLYFSDINLLTNGIKLVNFLELNEISVSQLNLTIHCEHLPESLDKLFVSIISNKVKLSEDIIKSDFLSQEFIMKYNQYITDENLSTTIFNENMIVNLMNSFSFDYAHSYFYETIYNFHYIEKKSFILLEQSDQIKENVLGSYVRLLSSYVYNDIYDLYTRVKNLVTIFYILFFMIIISLYFFVWRPLEKKVDSDVRYYYFKFI